MAEFRVHRVNFFHYMPTAIHNLAYDETTDKLALSRANGSIEIWDLRNDWFQEKIFPPCEDQSIEALLWCRGHLLSAGLHGNVLQHDLLRLSTKKSISANSGAIWCLTANHDDSQIAAGTEDGCVALFHVTEEGVEYNKSLNRQEGRILCIAWYTGEQGENLIVTGGVDNIRIWSVKSGHAIQRLTLGRQQKNKETIVWALAVAKDFTIVSGDSRGKTCFWDGRTGTAIKTFSGYDADILTIAVNKTGTTVYAAGVHPSVITYMLTDGEGGKLQWVRSVVQTQHNRDIRALTLTKNTIVSGGVDCNLVINTINRNKKDDRRWGRIPAMPQVGSLADAAKKVNMVLFQYPEYLEIWKLAKTSAQSDKTGEILPLMSKPTKLVQLKSRSETIVCSAIHPEGTWVAYCDQESFRMFSLQVEESEFEAPIVSLNKVKVAGSHILPAHIMKFTPDGETLVSATCEGTIQLYQILDSQPTLIHTFVADPDNVTGIHLLAVSQDSRYFAFGDHECNVRIYNVKRKKYVGSLPTYSHQPTALCFHPEEPIVLVMYADQRLHEYNFIKEEYTDWSRFVNKSLHGQWKKRTSKIKHLIYNQQDTKQIIMADEQLLLVLDRKRPMPRRDEKIFDKALWYKEEHSSTPHAYLLCSRYRYILHVDQLEDDYLLVVERKQAAIAENLPLPLKQKKFGT